jgi:hypothetical protein
LGDIEEREREMAEKRQAREKMTQCSIAWLPDARYHVLAEEEPFTTGHLYRPSPKEGDRSLRGSPCGDLPQMGPTEGAAAQHDSQP